MMRRTSSIVHRRSSIVSRSWRSIACLVALTGSLGMTTIADRTPISNLSGMTGHARRYLALVEALGRLNPESVDFHTAQTLPRHSPGSVGCFRSGSANVVEPIECKRSIGRRADTSRQPCPPARGGGSPCRSTAGAQAAVFRGTAAPFRRRPTRPAVPRRYIPHRRNACAAVGTVARLRSAIEATCRLSGPVCGQSRPAPCGHYSRD